MLISALTGKMLPSFGIVLRSKTKMLNRWIKKDKYQKDFSYNFLAFIFIINQHIKLIYKK